MESLLNERHRKLIKCSFAKIILPMHVAFQKKEIDYFEGEKIEGSYLKVARLDSLGGIPPKFEH